MTATATRPTTASSARPSFTSQAANYLEKAARRALAASALGEAVRIAL